MEEVALAEGELQVSGHLEHTAGGDEEVHRIEEGEGVVGPA